MLRGLQLQPLQQLHLPARVACVVRVEEWTWTAALCAPERELPRKSTEVRYGGIPLAYRNKPRPAHRMKSSSREYMYIHGGITQNMGCVAYTT